MTSYFPINDDDGLSVSYYYNKCLHSAYSVAMKSFTACTFAFVSVVG